MHTLLLFVGLAAVVGVSVYFAPKITGFFHKQVASAEADLAAFVKKV